MFRFLHANSTSYNIWYFESYFDNELYYSYLVAHNTSVTSRLKRVVSFRVLHDHPLERVGRERRPRSRVLPRLHNRVRLGEAAVHDVRVHVREELFSLYIINTDCQ